MDINPLAVLITRLRLFIALIDARLRGDGEPSQDPMPLPNLETRCLAANTLCVKLSAQGAFGGDGEAAVDDLRAARQAWVTAHHPDAKGMALADERTTRSRLREVLAGWTPDGELAWLDVDLLSPSAPPAHFDLRQLFPAPPGGWSIVIGNPPYQKPDAPDRERGRRLGYAGASANLYLMFIEAGLALLRPGGCAVLVVPHSIVFRRKGAFPKVRKLLEEGSARVDFRTYDNRPLPLFPALPWLKRGQSDKGNRQRATILAFRKQASPNASGEVAIASGGLIRLGAQTRETVLRQPTLRQQQRHWRKQWSQAPTPELADLLAAMRDEDRAPPDGAGMKTVTFPPTAMYFISCLPEGTVNNPRRQGHTIPHDRFFWPWIGLYNSHLFHAYWLMVGDAFDVTAEEYASVRPPAGWNDEGLRKETESVARRLLADDTLDSCLTLSRMRGKEWSNVNFHKPNSLGPAIVNELDHLLLAAYGFAPEPLINQMRTIRTQGSHCFPA